MTAAVTALGVVVRRAIYSSRDNIKNQKHENQHRKANRAFGVEDGRSFRRAKNDPTESATTPTGTTASNLFNCRLVSFVAFGNRILSIGIVTIFIAYLHPSVR